MDFQWDDEKNVKNFRKHGIWFEEAISVFDDPYAREIPDIDHSENEARWVILGMCSELRVLVVIYAERMDGEIIRPISARKATKRELESYRRLLK